MAVVVMLLDMLEADRLGNARPLIEFAQITGQVGIILDTPDIALEVTVVDRIKPHQRGEQSPIRLGNALPSQVSPLREQAVEPVQGREQRPALLLVDVLS